jgi:hypothetical protein
MRFLFNVKLGVRILAWGQESFDLKDNTQRAWGW